MPSTTPSIATSTLLPTVRRADDRPARGLCRVMASLLLLLRRPPLRSHIFDRFPTAEYDYAQVMTDDDDDAEFRNGTGGPASSTRSPQWRPNAAIWPRPVRAHVELADHMFQVAPYDDVIDEYLAAREAYQQVDTVMATRCMLTIGFIAESVGDHHTAQQAFTISCDEWDEHGERRLHAEASNNVGGMATHTGDYMRSPNRLCSWRSPSTRISAFPTKLWARESISQICTGAPDAERWPSPSFAPCDPLFPQRLACPSLHGVVGCTECRILPIQRGSQRIDRCCRGFHRYRRHRRCP